MFKKCVLASCTGAKSGCPTRKDKEGGRESALVVQMEVTHTLSLDRRERERESLGNIGNAMNICMIL